MEEAAREHLEKALAHRFANVALLTEALTHPSLARGRAEPRSYERLEFLGDRVLGLVVADILRDLYPEATAGDLARRYNALVRREALADVGRGIGLGAYLYIAPADRTAGVAENDTVLSDAMEALLAALYIDGGIEAARIFICAKWKGRAEGVVDPPSDAKTELQERVQAMGKAPPVYHLRAQVGPDHRPTLTVEAVVDGLPRVSGSGLSKQLAEQAAATELLAALCRESGGKQ